MWKHMARIIGEVLPQYVIVENSPMLVGRGLGMVLADLAEMGYDAEWGIVGAHHVAAPHKRERIWIVAHSNSAGLQDGWAESNRRMARSDEGRESTSDHLSTPAESGSRPLMANANVPFSERARQPDRINPEHAELNSSSAWWGQDPAETPKSNVGRMANGVAARVDRLRCIGNGQVPAVAALAWNLLR
jgi:DNA (cytosine-5)-methyltransferase 1